MSSSCRTSCGIAAYQPRKVAPARRQDAVGPFDSIDALRDRLRSCRQFVPASETEAPHNFPPSSAHVHGHCADIKSLVLGLHQAAVRFRVRAFAVNDDDASRHPCLDVRQPVGDANAARARRISDRYQPSASAEASVRRRDRGEVLRAAWGLQCQFWGSSSTSERARCVA